MLLKDEIEQDDWKYPNEFKAELNKRYEYYRSGAK